MSFQVPAVFTAIDKYTRPVRKMGAATRAFSDSAVATVDRVNRKFNKLIPSVGTAAKQFLSFASAAAVTGAAIAAINFGVQGVISYQENMASLSAITGVTGKQFEAFDAQVDAVAASTKKNAGEVAKAFEIVGSAKPELLANADALGEVTEASIILSKATKEELDVSAKALTGTLNQFGLEADQSMRVINALAAGSQAGAAAVPLISEALDKFGTVAASVNVNVEQSIGLIETLAEKNVVGAEAGTKLRNVLLKLATVKALPAEALKQLEKFGVNTDVVSNSSLSLETRLTELSKIQDDATALAKVFGKENITAGQIILQNVDKVTKYTKAVTGSNVAIQQAEIQSNVFTVALAELRAAWVNIFVSQSKANGAMVAATKIVQFLGDNLGTIINIIGILVGSWLALKLIMLTTKAVMLAYNIVLGIQTALTGGSVIALRSSTVALRAAAITTKILTAAQWLLNTAMTANPIGLVIAAIAALIGIIALVIVKYDEWGAALTLVLGPLGLVINLVQSFRKNWDAVKEAFASGGILQGLKAIGKVILDAVLVPVQQLLSLLSNIPGLDIAGEFATDIEAFRASLFEPETPENVQPVNTQASIENVRTEREERVTTNRISIDVKDPGRNTETTVTGDNPPPINLEPTFSF